MTRNPIRYIQDGEAVNAAVTGRPDRALAQQMNSLRSQVEAAQTGEAIRIASAAVSTSCVAGQAVYWNGTNSRFEPALAEVELDSVLGIYQMAERAQWLGVIERKITAATADVVLGGRVELDITDVVTGDVEAGVYYLSAATAGMLTATPPNVPMPVLFNDGTGYVYVMNSFVATPSNHNHYRFELYSQTAGDHNGPAPGDVHEIDNADDASRGWLPADDASFGGLAPDGAVFGYNLSQHPSLAAAFPPVPTSGALLLWTNEDDLTGAAEVPPSLYTIDQNGIWWLTNCYGEVPWPTSFAGSSVESSSAGIQCGEVGRKVWISFTKANEALINQVVNSLEAGDSAIIVRRCDGTAGDTGALEVLLNLTTSDTGSVSGDFLKTLTGNQLIVGPGVAGIRAGNSNITISGSDSFSSGGNTYYNGLLVAELSNTASVVQLQPLLARLTDSVERYYENVPFISFPAARNSEIVYTFEVPDDLVFTTPRVRLRMQVLGTVSGTIPALTVEYVILPRADSVNSNLNSLSPTAVTPTYSDSTLSTAYEYTELITDYFDVDPGDTVIAYVSRGSADGYSGEVGILRHIALLTE
jgi:hypothetical protein